MHIANHTPEVVRTRTVGWGHEQGNRGWAIFASGQEAAGIGQMRQGLAALQATGGEVRRPLFLALLAGVLFIMSCCLAHPGRGSRC
jgi:hypothetical protein